MSKPIYIILKSPQGKYKAVKCGDSYFAGFFSSLWALYHGLFLIFVRKILFYELLFGLLNFLVPKPDRWLGMFMLCILCIVFWKKIKFQEYANYWLIKKKIKEGYIITGVVETENFFEVMSLYKQNVNKKRVAKREFKKLKTDGSPLVMSMQCMLCMDTTYDCLDIEDMRACNHALLKIAKRKDSELLELCGRGFQIYLCNTVALSKIIFMKRVIWKRGMKCAMTLMLNDETMTEKEKEDRLSLCALVLVRNILPMSMLDHMRQKMLEEDETMELMMMKERDRNAYYYIKDLSYRKFQESVKSPSLEMESALLESERLFKLFADKVHSRSV